MRADELASYDANLAGDIKRELRTSNRTTPTELAKRLPGAPKLPAIYLVLRDFKRDGLIEMDQRCSIHVTKKGDKEFRK